MMEADKPWDLKERTRKFAVRVFRLVQALPRTDSARIVANQRLRAGTSVEANYRAAVRPRSQADFISKMTIVEEEIDVCIYWMELLVETGLVKKDRLAGLLGEADELAAIVVASIRTAKKKRG